MGAWLARSIQAYKAVADAEMTTGSSWIHVDPAGCLQGQPGLHWPGIWPFVTIHGSWLAQYGVADVHEEPQHLRWMQHRMLHLSGLSSALTDKLPKPCSFSLIQAKG